MAKAIRNPNIRQSHNQLSEFLFYFIHVPMQFCDFTREQCDILTVAIFDYMRDKKLLKED